MHHRFDDSPDDYEMDMDQRTRMLGRHGRIILLGDGTEILTGHAHDHDGDVDMDERGDVEEVEGSEDSSEEKDLEEQVQKNQGQKPNGDAEKDRSQREETPAPSSNDMTQKVEESKQRLTAADAAKPEDPTTMAATDSADTKKLAEAAAAETK